MKRKLLSIGAAAALATAFPASSAGPRTETPRTASVATAPVVVARYVGFVTDYTLGTRLLVAVGKKTRYLVLDAERTAVIIDPLVRIGSKVTVVEAQEPDGIKSIRVGLAS